MIKNIIYYKTAIYRQREYCSSYNLKIYIIVTLILNPVDLKSYLIRFKEKLPEVKWQIYNSLYSPNNIIGIGPLTTMFEQNIIDPLKVTRCALLNAVSVAKTILSTEAIVLNESEWME